MGRRSHSSLACSTWKGNLESSVRVLSLSCPGTPHPEPKSASAPESESASAPESESEATNWERGAGM